MAQSMSEARARAVYAILVAQCKAPESDEERFVQHFTSPDPTSEWRFQGALGFGGKFRYPRMRVDFYPEDETPERVKMAQSAMAQLDSLTVR